MVHLFVLFLQCWCLYKDHDFIPQKLQYNIIIQYLYPDKESRIEKWEGSSSMSFRSMLMRLMDRPFYNIFPFIEFSIALYVWGELLYPSTNCNNVPPLSSYYYPILMTLFDMCKLNLYNAGIHMEKNEYMHAIAASFDLYSIFFYIVLSAVLGIHFIYYIVKWACVSIYYILKQCIRGNKDVNIDVEESSPRRLSELTNSTTNVMLVV